MSRPSSVMPTSRSSAKHNPVAANPVIHPVLQQALHNLDVQLEDELARYRRQRIAQHALKHAKKEEKATSGSGNPAKAKAPLTMPPLLADNAGSSDRSATPAPPPFTFPAKSEFNPPPSHANGAIAAPPQPSVAADSPPAEVGAGLVAVASAPDEEYLESSEELLRSLAAEEAKVRAERGVIQQLFTPMGLGSLLLLLLSSALFGYVVMNPKSVNRVLARFERQQPQSAPATPPTATNETPPQPNLAEQEFKRLDLGSLATLKEDGAPVSQAPIPTTSPQPLSTKAPVAPPSVTPGGVSVPADAPVNSAPAPSMPKTSTPAPLRPAGRVVPRAATAPRTGQARSPRSTAQPATATRANVAKPKTPAKAAPKRVAPEPRTRVEGTQVPYKVVTEFQNDSSLQTVRKNVPDAFVKNFSDGAKVQVGAYDNEIEARAKVEALRKQGIDAQIKKQ
ncbi:MAG TPA: hypothetical protein IGS53_11915 [Leptolyngbyaceae cyanobacterium M33_DOE_097]|uniref:SPOR domain-containing protein n=1 Tax=Oscillatoriales cyanobacterium SpSt-418 TaxID=2282169 RepID=A0A7C3PHJ1_9CYAN|nr:hypothetical protein [Leptolyngbyaceae cyanobacterium M33_DOE_097]